MTFLSLILVVVCVCQSSSLTTTTESSESTATTTEFDLNSTLSTSCSGDDDCTDLNVTTTVATEIRNISKPENGNKTSGVKKREPKALRSSADICTCDLQMHFCDINCCCDKDCSLADRTQVFKYCDLDPNRYVDDRYCSYIDHIYVNNTPFEWHVNSDGLFCVLSTNVPQSYLEQKEKPIGFTEAFKPNKASFWGSHYLDKLPFKASKSYVYGDPLLAIRGDSSRDFLRFPSRVLTSPCLIEKEVTYLKSSRSICSQTNIDPDNSALQFTSYFRNIKLITNPALLINATNIKGSIYLNCPKNTCLEIEPLLCDPHFNSCVNVNNASNIKFHCSFDLKKNLNSCFNAPRKVFYKFYHNGTRGLQRVQVRGVLSNFSYSFGRSEGDFEFLQEFIVEFLWVNQTRNYSEVFSGNPGYIVGKPLLIGEKELVIGNNTAVEKIRRFSDKFIDNFLVLPSSDRAGDCVKNDSQHIPVEFGYNLKTKCHLGSNLFVNKSAAASQICSYIQQSVFSLWGIATKINRTMVFGAFGNALSTIEEDWTDVLYKVDPWKFVTNYTQGNFSSNKSVLQCRNITTLLNIEVFYSRVTLNNLLNQNKVLGIAYNYLDIRNHSFTIDAPRKIVKVSLTLHTLVTFSDVTTEAKRKFVDPPGVDIRLPYDFFYPFIKIGNGAPKWGPTAGTLFFVLVIRFYVSVI